MRIDLKSAFASIATLLVCLAFCGCSSTPNYAAMSTQDKARLRTKVVKEANYHLDLYMKSSEEPTGVDEDALLKYVDLWHEVTQIYGPGEDPQGYANHGVALSRLALHYQTLVAAFERELPEASPSSKREIEGKIARYTELMHQNFLRSNRQFDKYLENAVGLDTNAYKWLIGNCENLKNWKAAIHYLDLFASSVTLSEKEKKDLAELQRRYSEELRRQEEHDFEREMRDGLREEPARGSPPRRVEPAN